MHPNSQECEEDHLLHPGRHLNAVMAAPALTPTPCSTHAEEQLPPRLLPLLLRRHARATRPSPPLSSNSQRTCACSCPRNSRYTTPASSSTREREPRRRRVRPTACARPLSARRYRERGTRARLARRHRRVAICVYVSRRTRKYGPPRRGLHLPHNLSCARSDPVESGVNMMDGYRSRCDAVRRVGVGVGVNR